MTEQRLVIHTEDPDRWLLCNKHSRRWWAWNGERWVPATTEHFEGIDLDDPTPNR